MPVVTADEVTYEDVQQIIKQERLWWSESSARQIKNIEVQTEEQVQRAFDMLRKLNVELKTMIVGKLNQERDERAGNFEEFKKDIKEQQLINVEIGAQVRRCPTITDMASFRQEMVASMDAIRSDVEAVREEYRKKVKAEAGNLASQLLQLEGAMAELRSENNDLRSQHEARVVVMDMTIEAMRAEFQEAQAAKDMKLKTMENTLTVLEQQHAQGAEALRHQLRAQAGDSTANGAELSMQVKAVEVRVGSMEAALRQELEDSRLECARIVDTERSARRTEAAELRAQVLKADDRYHQLEKGVQVEAQTYKQDVLQLRSALDELTGKADDALQKADAGQKMAATASAVVASTTTRLKSEASTREQEVERVATQLARERAERAEQAATLTVRLEDRKSDIAELRYLIEHQVQAQADEIRGFRQAAASASRTDSTAELESAISKALAREKAQLEARGESASQLRDEFGGRLRSLEADIQVELASRFSTVDTGLRKEVSERFIGLDEELHELTTKVKAVQSDHRQTAGAIGTTLPTMSARLEKLEETTRSVQAKADQTASQHATLAARFDADQRKASMTAALLPTPARSDAASEEPSLRAIEVGFAQRSQLANRVLDDVHVSRGSSKEATGRQAAAELLSAKATPRADVEEDTLQSRADAVERALQSLGSSSCKVSSTTGVTSGATRLGFADQTLRFSDAGVSQEQNSNKEAASRRGAWMTSSASQATNAERSEPPSRGADGAPRQPTVIPLMNADLKDSLVSLVSKVHSALAEERSSPPAIPVEVEAIASPVPAPNAGPAFASHGVPAAAPPAIAPQGVPVAASAVFASVSLPPVFAPGSLPGAAPGHAAQANAQPMMNVTGATTAVASPVIVRSRAASPVQGRRVMSKSPVRAFVPAGAAATAPSPLAAIPVAATPLAATPLAAMGAATPVPVNESREVFKQALQELLEENKALRRETEGMGNPQVMPQEAVAMRRSGSVQLHAGPALHAPPRR